MPVRSGPTLPPSPPWRVALGAVLLEDQLARARRRRPCATRAASWSITFWRSGSGRPPPCAEQRLGPRRRSSGRDGRPGPASGRASARRAGPCPVSSAASKAGVQSARPSSVRSAVAARAGRQRRQRFDQGRADRRRLAAGHGVDQAGGQLGRACAGVIRSSSCLATVVVVAAQLDELPGGVDARATRLSFSSRGRGQQATRRSRRRSSSSAWLPQRPAKPDELPVRRGGQLGSKRAERPLRVARRARPAGPWASRGPGRR